VKRRDFIALIGGVAARGVLEMPRRSAQHRAAFVCAFVLRQHNAQHLLL
jgi:hypothetical protein